ncbi:amino acid permease [Actinomycetospora corticicola]|uniref:Amino acid transporter n=1 Tax=Actinomycetospora corticicola TaxID=663602 RepID=A0A7Y9DRY9_9PSEU|nr:amino acid permease [Actinomycetospora corticicola]NYD34441.1 amino acid transporter [Actinomycetospora corticicola]
MTARGTKLGVLALAMINVAAIVSARNLPVMAEYGWSMLVLFALSILVFLVPIAMAAAELGTAWPRDGGVYAWVKEAFGERTGFLAVWCDYSENVAWFPTVLSFIAASLAYAVNPALATNTVFLVVVMITIFWLTTLASLRGVGASARLGAIGTVAGSIIPAVLVVVLGAAYLLQGRPSAIPFSAGALVPDLQIDNLAFLAGIVLLFTGMEMAGFHARHVEDPGRVVPRAILLCVGITIVFSVVGSLFMAFVVPASELSLVSGTMELFRSALDSLGVGWLVAPLALLIAFGGVAHLTPWILGPAEGVAAVAREGSAPRRLGRTNARDVPVTLVMVQGVAGSVFALLFLLVPSVSTSYWMLSAVTAQIVVIMYGLMFAAVIRLRYTRPDVPRPYRIPGGLPGVWAAGGIGLLGCVFSFVLGFVPPSQLTTGSTTVYVALLAVAVVVLSCPPFVVAALDRRRARIRPTAPAPVA